MEGYLGILNAGTTFGEVGGRFAIAFVQAPNESFVRHRARTSDVYSKRCLLTAGKQLCLKLRIFTRTLLMRIP